MRFARFKRQILAQFCLRVFQTKLCNLGFVWTLFFKFACVFGLNFSKISANSSFYAIIMRNLRRFTLARHGAKARKKVDNGEFISGFGRANL